MKDFIISLIIFSLALALLIANSVFVSNSVDEMLLLSENDIELLHTYWNERISLFSLTFGNDATEKLSLAIELARLNKNIGDMGEYCRSVITLRAIILQFKRQECFAFYSFT